MGIVKPVRGVKEDIMKHLSLCSHCPANISAEFETGFEGSLNPSSSQPKIPQLYQARLLCKPQDSQWTKAQVADFQIDFLRLCIAINASFNAVDHPEVTDICTKWVGIKSPSRWLLRNRLLKSQINLLESQMKTKVFGKEGTLSRDGWNNKKRQHLVAFPLNIEGKTYPLDVVDSSAAYKGGAEAFHRIETILTKLANMGVIVVGLCTDNGADQVFVRVYVTSE